MKRLGIVCIIVAVGAGTLLVAGCGTDEAAVRAIVQEELAKDHAASVETMKQLQKFGFGGALEKEWSHSQGVRAGNFIFVSGQQPYDTNLDDKGMPLTDLETGRNFAQQLRTALENVQKVLANYGASTNDVVMLQGFIDEKAGKNAADFGDAAKVIQEFFPNGQQSMTFISVDNLFGPEQLIEVNAIAFKPE